MLVAVDAQKDFTNVGSIAEALVLSLQYRGD
jgi:hypothetical protein